MTSNPAQVLKAQDFLALHAAPELLVLPNIWDPLGAQLLVSMGFPAVATASASVAYSLGYDDGEVISFETMLNAVSCIVSAVSVPVSADIERGYASNTSELTDHIHRLLEVGVVGINLEDSVSEEGPLRTIDRQVERIHAVVQAAQTVGVPLVINARIDTFLERSNASLSARIESTITRARAYVDAGATCVCPIGAGSLEVINPIIGAIDSFINVYLSPTCASMPHLEEAGVSRVSTGPGMIKASLAAMRQMAHGLEAHLPFDQCTSGQMASSDIEKLVRPSQAKREGG
jgi:2-methylisocitrate lyase-like PEP mutase family enzyme